jgi:hypothetical protein
LASAQAQVEAVAPRQGLAAEAPARPQARAEVRLSLVLASAPLGPAQFALEPAQALEPVERLAPACFEPLFSARHYGLGSIPKRLWPRAARCNREFDYLFSYAPFFNVF